MILTDKEIIAKIDERTLLIEGYDEDCVTSIGYDLRTKCLYTDDKHERQELTLLPGESAFVGSEEVVSVPTSLCCKVYLKNSRIRQGLSLDAPVYQPGHQTRIYFRLTNVSKDELVLRAGEQYAMLVFEQLEGVPAEPYNGVFVDEFTFGGLGKYQNMYDDQVRKLTKKQKDLESIEKSIYGNVLVILSVFVALFSILVTNVPSLATAVSVQKLIGFDLAILGSVTFLSGLLAGAVGARGRNIWYIVLGILIVLGGMWCLL